MSLPLTWADKINSPSLADFIEKYGAEYCLTAEEINEMRDAVNAMAVIQQSTFQGDAEPGDTPAGTGNRYWTAVTPGTYTNFGGVVVGANSLAIISVTAAGDFSISQTALDISGKVNVSDVVDGLNSTETAKPLSANQGKVLNEKKADKIDLMFALKISLEANIEGLLKTDGGAIDPFSYYRRTDFFEFTPNKKYTYSANVSAGSLFAGVCYFNASYTFISYEIQGGSVDRVETDFVLTIPATAKYIKFGLTNSVGGVAQSLNVKEFNLIDIQAVYNIIRSNENQIITNIYTALGDSISYGVGSTGGVTSWCNILATRLGSSFTKLAVSGNSLWSHLRGQVVNIPIDTTFCTIMMGANDVTPINDSTYAIGSINTVLSMVNDEPIDYASSDLYNDSFLGRFRWCLEFSITNNPNTTFVVVTPIAWTDETGTIHTTLENIRKGQKAIAESLGIKVVRITEKDIYESPDFNIYLNDLLHPNDKGHNQIANVVYSELL